MNVEEAQQITDWISLHFREIVDAYGGKAGGGLGIITPFKAQAALLKGYLEQKAPDVFREVTVGTVHTFQGAQRKIILFSTVYGAINGCFFIDRNQSLMNVAVSRAEDAFLVFGARGCLKSTSESASGLMKELITLPVE